eukprot:TRINITY_DN14363_c0_g1_i1.p1 TRINITY_DN14363_c0_g1~~TRINITY_DN14363_c0_g1_i1.p1  ORF type:complete len:127 (-),score=33.51 TRINITY_DN14363_c0_g1_i1:75-455(-)
MECVRTLCKKFSHKTVEWKELSHAVRVADELKELYETGGITLPLPSRATVMAIKLGHTPFAEVERLLTARVAELEVLTAASKHPEVPNRAFWDDFLCCHIARFHGLPKHAGCHSATMVPSTESPTP